MHKGHPAGPAAGYGGRATHRASPGNLLSNAVRHSQQSFPFGIETVREGVHAEVSLTDDGVGKLSDHLPYLFGKFLRIEGEGTGRGHRPASAWPSARAWWRSRGCIWSESDELGLALLLLDLLLPRTYGIDLMKEVH